MGRLLMRGQLTAWMVLLVVAGLAVPVRAAVEVSPRVLSALAQAPADSVPVIVTMQDQVNLHAFARDVSSLRKLGKEERRAHRSRLVRTLKERATNTQGDLRRFLRDRGVDRIRDLWHVNSLAFRATPELIGELSARPEIASIAYDQPIRKPEVTKLVDADANDIEDNLDLIGAPQLWGGGLTGAGTTVAIVDSGVDLDHPDLIDRWRGGGRSGWLNAVAENCADPLITCQTTCDTNTTEPCDFLDGGGTAHGTAVAGIAVGGSAGGNAIGVAPEATWIAAKIFDSQDSSSTSVISEAFAWLLDPDGNPATDDAPDVVNASWGFDPDQCVESLRADVQAVQAAGIAVTFSGGNGGPASSTSVSPANYPESFAVGSVGTFVSPTTVSDFSGRGPSACGPELYPDLVAPGFRVLTADFYITGNPFAYITLTGTSFSAPHVAGAIALLVGNGGFATVSLDVLYRALGEAAVDLGPAGPDNDYGNGLLDVDAAYDLLLPPVPAPVMPADGSEGLATSLTLGWTQPADVFGSVVTNEVLIDTDPLFSAPIVASGSAESSRQEALLGLVGLSGLLLIPWGGRVRGRKWLVVLVTLVGLMALTSCGGGGGHEGVPLPDPDRSVVVDGLTANTTYYWKVIAQTDRGGPVSESTVFSFTTAP